MSHGRIAPDDAYLVIVGQQNEVNVRKLLWRHPRERVSHSFRVARPGSLVEHNHMPLGPRLLELLEGFFEEIVKRLRDGCIDMICLRHGEHIEPSRIGAFCIAPEQRYFFVPLEVIRPAVSSPVTHAEMSSARTARASAVTKLWSGRC